MSAPMLSSVGLDITRCFGEVDALNRQVGDTKYREWPRALFAAESDRFELWSINMGLLVPGHGSLDYRIRDSTSLKTTFAKFMTDLRDSLDQVLQYGSGAFDNHAALESPHDADDPDGSDGDWTVHASAPAQPSTEVDSTFTLVGEDDSDIDLLVDGVRDPIDRLYKLEKLRLHRHNVVQQARVPITSATVAFENLVLPTAGDLDPVLISAASVTTATCLQVTQLTVRDDQSTVSQSEYAPSSHPGVDVIDFPPPPKGKESGNFFECPYCFTLCPSRSLDIKAWRAHLIRDLRPYICTYETCRNPDQLYDTREDWIQHETTSHFAAWRCLEHEGLAFPSVEAYQTHLATCHGAAGHAELSSSFKADESSLIPPDRRCPICNFSPAAAGDLHKHVALHLERISLFSLPHVSGDDDDDGDDAGSQRVNFPDDGSRNDQSTNLSEGVFGDDNDDDRSSKLSRAGRRSSRLLMEDKRGQASLLDAVRNGDEGTVRKTKIGWHHSYEPLGAGNVDIDTKDNQGLTPLSLAAVKGHEAVVKLLVDTGKVDINSQDSRGLAPLCLVAQHSVEDFDMILRLPGR
ncbi:hypothetical protein F5144DRAFT_637326 [Chaetomium tenue]|uniref:Uncharacterized protein n=1 Tax=Chaetomium tenue TaxID=1854479 RepID=A0ACB7PN11_9PEZI|nr:hypothetical protein F5144DRAFT_637326 [Chaetomium globosum]